MRSSLSLPQGDRDAYAAIYTVLDGVRCVVCRGWLLTMHGSPPWHCHMTYLALEAGVAVALHFYWHQRCDVIAVALHFYWHRHCNVTA